MTEIIQVLVYGIAVGSVYGLVALGFVLVFKTCGAFNLAQGEVLMVMAFLCYTFSDVLQLPFYLAILLTIGVAVLFGYVLERLILRPMIGQPIIGMLMITLGLAILLKALEQFGWSYHSFRYPQWLPTGELSLAGVVLSWDYVSSLVIVAVLLGAFALFFKKARYALAMRAVGMSQIVSQAMGIKISSMYGLAWALALAVAAIGGIMLGTLTAVSSALSGIGLYVIPAIIIGGLTSIPGSIVGGLIIGIAEKYAQMYLGVALPGVAPVVPYILAMIILYVMPTGLWGEKIIERI
jgi:branched-chain amino acid transport system permease protein